MELDDPSLTEQLSTIEQKIEEALKGENFKVS